MWKVVEVLAHRTGMGQYPPNSLEGLKGSWQNGAVGFECDLTFTSLDEEPFVWIGEMKGILKSPKTEMDKMSRYQVAWLGRTDCEENILHLNDVFDFLEQYPVRAYFDVKYYQKDLFGQFSSISCHLIDLTVRKVIQPALERNLAHQIGFVTFGGGVSLLREVKVLNSRIATDLIISLPGLHIEEHLDYLDAVTIGWKKINPWRWPVFSKSLDKLLAAARQRGVKLHGGLADTSKEVEWLMKKDFDGIWTNQVKMVRQVLEVRQT